MSPAWIEVNFLWEWLPATIPSRSATADSHKKILNLLGERVQDSGKKLFTSPSTLSDP
jgi:hypothetical protein